jgi:uncharacterized protein YjbI with pentapeptide repeats
MKRLADFRKHVIEGWTVQRIAAVLIVVGLVVFVAGAVTQYCVCTGWPNLGDVLNHMIGDFYANVSVDCLSIAFAILVIDRLNEGRAEKELKAQLIREMRGSDYGFSLRALEELRARGWLRDGSMWRADLNSANLQNADLQRADLQNCRLNHANLQGAVLHAANLQEAGIRAANLYGADLTRANLQRVNFTGTNLENTYLREANCSNVIFMSVSLKGADMTKANLSGSILRQHHFITLHGLQGARMPSGSIYDGRYNLYGDMVIVHELLEMLGTQAIAQYYGVSLEEYEAGQEWARENLADLRREAGLDPDTGLPVEPTNGTEPLPADAPAPPVPRRNGHKASIVTHRVRR